MAATPPASKPVGHVFDAEREISIAARVLALDEAIPYSRAKELVRTAPQKYFGREVCDRIRYSRDQRDAHVANVRRQFAAIRKYCEENNLTEWAEMIDVVVKTHPNGREFGDQPQLASTHEEFQARADASDKKIEADYKAGMAANRR